MTGNEQKTYAAMSAEEQLRWVREYTRQRRDHAGRIAALAKGAKPWTADDSRMVTDMFRLFTVWPWAARFAEQALRYGDLDARVWRLPDYMRKAEAALAEGLVKRDAEGREYAAVPPGVPLRKRGRPTKSEQAARRRGEVPLPVDDTPETQRSEAIAGLLGLTVVREGDAPREKNNAELKAEREERARREAERQPVLFAEETAGASGGGTAGHPESGGADGAGAAVPAAGGLACPPMSEVYAGRIGQDRLHLDQIAWLCSDGLRERIAAVRDQRTAFGDAAQKAKFLAESRASQQEVAAWAEEAERQRALYEGTYEAVDWELAALHLRLQEDRPYRESFCERWKGVDLERIAYITRPYYEKMKGPELEARVRNLTRESSPEWAAELERREAEKREAQELMRYIKRTDKDASDERVATLEKRIERIRELKGDAEADALLPILEKTRRDNVAWRKERDRILAERREAKAKERAKAGGAKGDKKKGGKA